MSSAPLCLTRIGEGFYIKTGAHLLAFAGKTQERGGMPFWCVCWPVGDCLGIWWQRES